MPTRPGRSAKAAAGARFGEICEGLQAWLAPEAIALRAAGLFRQWVSDALVTTPDT